MNYRTLSAPLVVQIENTWVCNHRCGPCSNAVRHCEATRPTMSRDQIDVVVAELVKCEVPRAIITGGEPLLVRRQTYYLAEQLQRAEIRYSLNTNATLATPEDATVLKQYGMSGVMISLHGDTAELHDELTGVPGSWLRGTAGLRIFAEAGVDITANMVVTGRNAHRVLETGRLARSFGASTFQASKVCVPSSVLDHFQLSLPTPPQIRTSLDSLLLLEQETGMRIGIGTPYPWCVLEDAARYARFCGKFCGAGIVTAYIGPTGDVLACGMIAEPSGNLFREGLAAPWSRLTELRSRRLPDACMACGHKLRCAGGCYHEGRLASDKIPCRPGLGEGLVQTVPPRRRPVPVTDTTQFRFAEDTVLRQESFGGVISDGSQSTLVDSTTFGICRALRATGAFSVLYAANRFQVAVDEARDVLSRLAGQQLIRLVAPVSETKGKEVSQ